MKQKQPNPQPQFLLKIALAFLVFFGFSTAAQTVRASFLEDILSLPSQLAEGSQIAMTEVFPSFFNQASLTSVLNDIQCFFGFNCAETTINQEPITDSQSQTAENQNPITDNPELQQPESQTDIQPDQPKTPVQITQIINPTKEIQTIHTVTNNTNTVVVDNDTKNQVNQLLRQLNSDRPNYSTGQTVSLPTNLVSKTLNITSGDFNVDDNGNIIANDITSNGNLTVQGNFTVSGSQTYSGAASFTATSTTPALLIEQTGSGNALQADNVTIKDSMIATDNGGALQFQTANNYLDASGNLVLSGDITAGKYNGLTINPTTKSLTVSNDATVSGTNTGDQTITLTGDITGSGTGSFATTIGNAKVTNAMLAGSIAASKLIGTDIATVGTITTGIWNGTTISPTKGGTGIANGTNNTITFTGNYTLGLTLSANTSLTLPTNGTLATTSDKLNAFASTNSSELAGTISDETGSGSLVFATSPTFTTQLTAPKVVGDTTGLYLNEDGGAGIFVKDGGNVGIGNTNPSSKLEVTGDIRISSGSGGQIIFADGSTMVSSGLGSAAALSNTTDAIMTGDSDANNTGAVIFKTGSNDRLHILNTGDIGIGTASPNTKLDVRGGINAGTNGTEFTLSSAGAVTAITYNGLTLTSQATGYTISGGTASKTLTLDDNLTATTINSHLASTSNPHGVTQSQVGLGSVENTALSTWAGTGNITTVGTITTGTWNGTTISPTKGGTGIANGTNNTITFTGNYTLGLTLSANTSLNLPASGTLATTSDKLSAFASTSSSELAGTISDETGSGALVFATSPTFTTQLTTPKVVGDTTGLYLNEDGGAGIFVKDGGNVGIGTTNPGYQFESYINSNSMPSLVVATNASNGDAAGALMAATNNAGYSVSMGILGSGNTAIPTYGTANDTYVRSSASAGSLNLMVANSAATSMMKFFVGEPANGTASMILDNSGNVGIGTTAPTSPLEVIGNIETSSNLVNNNAITTYQAGSYNDATIYRLDFLNPYTSNADGNQYATSGNISIKAQGLAWSIAESNEPKGAEIYLESGRSPNAGTVNGAIYLRTGGSTHAQGLDRMTVTGDGNVGIDTTAPLSKLDVNVGSAGTDLSTRGILQEFYGHSNYWKGNISMVAEGTKASPAIVTTSSNQSLGYPLFYDGGVWRIGALIDSKVSAVTANTSIASELRFWTGTVTGDALAGVATGMTQRMVIDKDGNVGIGKTNPSSSLDVNGNITLSNYTSNPTIQMWLDNSYQDSIIFKHPSETGAAAKIATVGSGGYATKGLAFYTSDALDYTTDAGERMRIAEGGNVGIGITAPAYPLDVYTTSGTPATINGVATYEEVGVFRTDGGKGIGFGGNDTNHVSYIRSIYNGGDLSLVTRSGALNSERIRIASAGNIGIGTTNPGNKLEIVPGGGWVNMPYQASVTDGYRLGLGDFDFRLWRNYTNGPQDTAVFSTNWHLNSAGTNVIDSAGQPTSFIKLGTNNPGGVPAISFGTGNGVGNVPTVRMAISDSGNVGIGVTNSVYQVDIQAPGHANYGNILSVGTTDNTQAADNPRILFNYRNGTKYWGVGGLWSGASTSAFSILEDTNSQSAGTSRLTILAGGNTGLGTIAPNYQLQLSSDSAGKPNGGSWANSSDQRLKTSIATMDDALNKLMQLRGVNFNWINQDEHPYEQGIQGGFIAQEVARIFPGWVKEVDGTGKDGQLANGKIKSLSLPFEFDALVVEAIKEQQGQISDLKLQLNDLGIIAATSTFDIVQGGINPMQWLISGLQTLGLALRDGVANLKAVVADKMTSRQMVTQQVCVAGTDGETVCLDKNQLKDLIQKAGSSVTVNQTYQAPATPITNSTTTETEE